MTEKEQRQIITEAFIDQVTSRLLKSQVQIKELQERVQLLEDATLKGQSDES